MIKYKHYILIDIEIMFIKSIYKVKPLLEFTLHVAP